MSQVDELPDPEYFDLMIARFTPKLSASECRIRTVRELDERLAETMTEPMLAIGIGCVTKDADWDHFLLLLNGDRAWIHLMAGRCITARDPNSLSSQTLVNFQDDAGVSHKIAFQDTVSRDQGLRALRHWLPRGDKLTELVWG
jgi:hypothetical protein